MPMHRGCGSRDQYACRFYMQSLRVSQSELVWYCMYVYKINYYYTVRKLKFNVDNSYTKTQTHAVLLLQSVHQPRHLSNCLCKAWLLRDDTITFFSSLYLGLLLTFSPAYYFGKMSYVSKFNSMIHVSILPLSGTHCHL